RAPRGGPRGAEGVPRRRPRGRGVAAGEGSDPRRERLRRRLDARDPRGRGALRRRRAGAAARTMGRRHRAPRGGRRGGGPALVRRAAAVAPARPSHAGSGLPEGRPAVGRRARLSRGPRRVASQRLVALRALARAGAPGTDRRGGGGEARPPRGVGPRGRTAPHELSLPPPDLSRTLVGPSPAPRPRQRTMTRGLPALAGAVLGRLFVAGGLTVLLELGPPPPPPPEG